jgi:hypothetical protein
MNLERRFGYGEEEVLVGEEPPQTTAFDGL